jgi:ABC-2 type transport system ATP-binding protein
MQSDPLTVSLVVRHFGNYRAVDGASLVLRRGEFLGLLGPNGAGKTTLIRMISGRLKPESGRIVVHGMEQRVGGHPDIMPRLGIIPQNIALYDNLTACENLSLFGTLFGVPSSDLSPRIHDALKWTGLEDRSNEPVSRISGGMQRRLNIACGVLHQPDVILLDEPTVGVDPQSRQRIWEMLKELQSKGVSIVLTTHQLDEAQQICDRIAIMDRGRIIASGTFDELLDASIGRRRRITFTFANRLTSFPHDCEPRGDQAASFYADDLTSELPRRLGQFAAAGATVLDLSIEVPTLQAVFLHFTGRELRESDGM